MQEEPPLSSAPVPYFPGETFTRKQAAVAAGVSVDTIPRWASKFGIGRQMAGPRSNWLISKPALAMQLAADERALAAYLAGDRSSEMVLRYFDFTGCRRPAAFTAESQAA